MRQEQCVEVATLLLEAADDQPDEEPDVAREPQLKKTRAGKEEA